MADKTKVYQIVPEKLSLMMCYVIKTKENKIIIIDGGIDGYGLENPTYLQSAIRAILGIGQNDYFEVEAWFLTHIHNDHFYELAKMLDKFTLSDNWRIKNLYFSFPPVQNGWESKGGKGDYSLKAEEVFRRGLRHYGDICGLESFDYDSLNGAVITPEAIKNGLTISVDECDFEILQTWDPDDMIVNSTSVIFRLKVSGKSILFLGDAYIDTDKRLLDTYGADYLKSDYVQLAHHGQNGCSKEFYLAIGTDKSIRLWPSPSWVWGVYKHEAIKSDVTRSWFGLPENPDEYFAQGFDKTGNDIVSGLYENLPADPTKVKDWTDSVLSEQLVLEC